MWKRILTAVVLLAVVLGTILGLRQFHTAYADAIGLVVCLIGMYEMYHAFKLAEYKPMMASLICGGILIYPAVYFLGSGGIIATLVLCAMISIIILTFDHSYDLKDLFSTIFILIYPLAMFATFFIINKSSWGLLGIMLALFIPIMTDTMAYFVGITFKGKKLCPEISPKKTISGAIGGLIGGILGGMIVFLLFDVYGVFKGFKNVGELQLTSSLVVSGVIYGIFGLVGGTISEIGDLGASWMKRKADIKDFGKIFPGHGGMMDRLDSILFVMPLVFIMLQILQAVKA